MLESKRKMLRGPDNTYYVGDGTATQFLFNPLTGLGEDSSWVNPLGEDSTIDPTKTITTSASQLIVHKNGVKQILNTDYTVDFGGKSLTTESSVDTSVHNIYNH